MEFKDRNQLLLATAAWAAELIGNPGLAYKLLQPPYDAPMLPITRAAGIGVDSLGGFLVPPAVSAEIIALRQVAGVARREATVWPIMRGDEMSVPRRTGSVTAAYMGENSTFVENDLVFDSIVLSPRKIGAYVLLSTEFQEDAGPTWASVLLGDFANALGLLEDATLFKADGSSTYAGQRGIGFLLTDGQHSAGNIPAASTHKTAATIDTSDVTSMLAALPEQYWPGAKIYCSGFMFNAGLARLAGTAGMASMDNGQPVYGNIPVVLTPELPGTGDLTGKLMIVFGDLGRGVALGSSRELTMATSTQKYLETDRAAVRCTERVHVNVHGCGDNSSAGPIVGLIGTA